MSPQPGFDARVVEFGEALRAEGVAIGTSELNDAFGALAAVPWTQQASFRAALAATLAKSPEDRRVFDLVFERHFFRAAEEGALRRGVREGTGGEDADGDPQAAAEGQRIDLDNLREQVLRAIRGGDEAAMRDLARLAIAALGRRGEGSGVLGVDVQRIRRALGLRSEPAGPGARGPARRSARAAAHPRPDPRASSSSCAASSSAGRSSAPSSCRPRGRSTSSTARCRAARCRTSPPSTASSPSSSGGSRRRATRSRASAGGRTSTSAARCAPRCRPAASPSS